MSNIKAESIKTMIKQSLFSKRILSYSIIKKALTMVMVICIASLTAIRTSSNKVQIGGTFVGNQGVLLSEGEIDVFDTFQNRNSLTLRKLNFSQGVLLSENQGVLLSETYFCNCLIISKLRRLRLLY